jgi:hypothetical protein
VVFRAGANATGLFRSIEGPAAWKCDTAGPRFALVAACTAAVMPPSAEATFTVTLAAPQPSAIPYRISAAIKAKGVKTLRREAAIGVTGSAKQTELTITAKKVDEERASFDIRNAGPDEAKDLTVVITNAALASGDGWTCKPSAYGVVCTRASLPVDASTTIAARGEATARMEARVRAEQVVEDEWRDNTAKP